MNAILKPVPTETVPAAEPDVITPSAYLEVCAQAVESGAKTSMAGILMAGQALVKAREALPADRDFGQWREARLPWLSRVMASHWMNVYRRFGDTPVLNNLTPTVAYALSAPSTSEEVREAALKLAEAGETLTVADVQTLKHRLQQVEQTRDQLVQRVEQMESRNRTLDLNLTAASEREQRSYRELVETQNKIADLAKAQADAAIEQARQEVQTGQQLIDELKAELEQRQREQRNAIRQGIQAGMTQRQNELQRLEQDIQQAEAHLQDYRQRLKQRTGDEHENQRLHIDAEKALRELMVLGTTINMFEAPVIYDVNQTLLERLKQCAEAVVPLIEQFQQNHGRQEKAVDAVVMPA